MMTIQLDSSRAHRGQRPRLFRILVTAVVGLGLATIGVTAQSTLARPPVLLAQQDDGTGGPESLPTPDNGEVTPNATPSEPTPEAAPDSEGCDVALGLADNVGGACVGLINASFDTGSIDLYLVDPRTPAMTAVPIGSFADFVSAPSGPIINAVITPVNEPVTLLTRVEINLEPGVAYVLVVTGFVFEGTLTIVPVPLDLDPIDPGGANLSVLHASPRSPALATWINDTPITENLVYLEISDAAAIPGEPVILQIRLDDESTVVLTVEDVTFEPTLSYVLVIADIGGEGNLTLLVGSAPLTNDLEGAA